MRAVLAVLLAASLQVAATLPAMADKPAALSPQTLTLPSGPASLKGLGESFSPNIATGAASYGVDIELPPAILAPKLRLSYSTGSGRGEVGIGFSLSKFFVYRTTDKGLPRYDETDRFAVSSPEVNDELVLVDWDKHWYRLKNEGAFALFVRDPRGDTWTVRFAGGETAILGAKPTARQSNSSATFRWFVSSRQDRFGHSIEYEYFSHRGHCYLSGIRYQLHASPSQQNVVALSYQNRPDAFTDYTYGERDQTAQRLKGIAVRHGDRLLRTYDLRYAANESFSELASVTVTGERGLAMPTLSFGWTPRSDRNAQLVEMGWHPPLDQFESGDATLEDVNGDGLPDYLVGEVLKYQYYENINGQRWARWPTYMGSAPDHRLGDPYTVLTDVNGDGFRDVLYSMGNELRYHAGGDIKDGVFRKFGTMRPLASSAGWLPLWSDKSLKQVDLNRDGRTDLLYQQGPGLVQQILNQKEDRLVSGQLPNLPGDVDFTDPRVSMIDVNGDGVLDFVRKDINPDLSHIYVWYGLGWGHYAPMTELFGAPRGLDNEFYLQDVNHDGQTDLVRVSGSTSATTSTRTACSPVPPAITRGCPRPGTRCRSCSRT